MAPEGRAAQQPSSRSGRPWYLVLALLVCSVLGACGSTEGWSTIMVYRTTQIDTTYVLRDVSQEENRKAAVAGVEKLLGAMEDERPRLFPLAAAELVLGVAMFVLSVGAMAGRAGARRAVVQIAAAQAALMIAMFLLTPRTRAAEVDLGMAVQTAKMKENGADPTLVDTSARAARKVEPFFDAAKLFGRTVAAALVMIALTRRRSRAFYDDAQGERPSES